MPQNKPTFQFTHLIFGRICDEVQSWCGMGGEGGKQNDRLNDQHKMNNTHTYRDQFARQHQKERGQTMRKKRERERI